MRRGRPEETRQREDERATGLSAVGGDASPLPERGVLLTVWLGGALIGGVTALFSLVAGLVGLFPGVLAGLLLLVMRPWIVALSGLLIGLGAVWLLVLSVVAGAAVEWILVSWISLLAGAGLAAAAVRSARIHAGQRAVPPKRAS